MGVYRKDIHIHQILCADLISAYSFRKFIRNLAAYLRAAYNIEKAISGLDSGAAELKKFIQIQPFTYGAHNIEKKIYRRCSCDGLICANVSRILSKFERLPKWGYNVKNSISARASVRI